MPNVDERIREELRRLERPVEVDGVMERVAGRRARRRVVRRVQAAALAMAVIGGSVVGGLWLSSLFGHPGASGPASRASLSPTGPNPTSAAGGSPQPWGEDMVCDQSQLYADVDGDGVPDQVDVFSPAPRCDSSEVGKRYVLHVSGGKAGPSGPGVNFYGVDQNLPECQQPGACRLFAAPDINDDGQAEVAVEVKAEGPTIYFALYELVELDTVAGPRFNQIEVAQPSDTAATAGDGLIPFAWGGDADRYEAVECRGDGPSRLLVASNAVPSQGNQGRYDVSELQLSFRNGTLHIEASADYPDLKPDQNPPFVTPSDLCGSPVLSADG